MAPSAAARRTDDVGGTEKRLASQGAEVRTSIAPRSAHAAIPRMAFAIVHKISPKPWELAKARNSSAARRASDQGWPAL